MDAPERERTTSEIGELIMEQLKKLDTVAYIRFASCVQGLQGCARVQRRAGRTAGEP